MAHETRLLNELRELVDVAETMVGTGAPVNGRVHHPYQFTTSVDGVLFDVVVSEYGGGTAIRRTDAMVRHIKFSHGSPWLDDPAEATRQSMAHSIRVQFGHYVESSS
jgi:hypothetical protein